MDRIDLLNALRLVMDYCKDRETAHGAYEMCNDCIITNECNKNICESVPCDWDLDDQ